MDEVKFGPRREIRLPSRYRRLFAAVAAAAALAAGTALAVTAAGSREAASPPGGSGPSAAPPQRAYCPPTQAAKPDVAALPAGLRPGALKVIGDAEFGGWCAVSG